MPAPDIQFKRGAYADLPGLQAGEPGITTDTRDFYIGYDGTLFGNRFFGSDRYWRRESTGSGGGPQESTTYQEKVENFLGTYWSAWVKKLRYGIIAVFSTWLVVAMVFATGLGPLTKPEEFIQRDHPVLLPFTLQEDVF